MALYYAQMMRYCVAAIGTSREAIMPSSAHLRLIIAALLFSTGGAAIKQATLTNWQIAGFRSGVAVLALLCMTPEARRGLSWRGALVGVAYAATLILFVTATKLTTAANTIFLQSTAPVYILLLGPWLLQEKFNKKDVSFLGVVAVGLSLFFFGNDQPSATAPNPFLGNIIALISGVAWGLTILGLRWMSRDASAAGGTSAVVLGNVIAFVACLPMALPVTNVSALDVTMILYLGVFQIGLAYLFLTIAMRRLAALEASLLLLIEPALNPLVAWMVHGEVPSALALVGGTIILGATLFKTWRDTRTA
jgi:drug/metabolite transporter, DME family